MRVYTVTLFNLDNGDDPVTHCFSSERAAFACYAYLVAEYANAQGFEKEAEVVYQDLLGGDVLLAELTAREIAGDLDGVWVVHDTHIPSEAFTFEGVRYREEV